MSVNNLNTDPLTGISSRVLERDNRAGQFVYTEQRKEFSIRTKPFLNNTYGIAMNQNGSFTGTPDKIHNGTDNAYWTGSQISGTKVTFDSTVRANAGTKSVELNNANIGDEWQFDKGSDIDNTLYSHLTFYVNIDKDWSVGDSISVFMYDTGTSSIVGSKVLLEDYINEFDFDVWQKAVIPFTDLDISTDFDAIRMIQEGKNGKAPKMYFDDIQLEESNGSGIEFKVLGSTSEVFHVYELNFSMADNITAVVTNGTMQGLSYNQILGVSALSNGINIRRVSNDDVLFSANIKQLSDFFNAGMTIENSISDGTNSLINLRIKFVDPIILTGIPSENFLSLTVNDNLTGLLLFNTFARGSIETQEI